MEFILERFIVLFIKINAFNLNFEILISQRRYLKNYNQK
jgi:hypothetical protein